MLQRRSWIRSAELTRPRGCVWVGDPLMKKSHRTQVSKEGADHTAKAGELQGGRMATKSVAEWEVLAPESSGRKCGTVPTRSGAKRERLRCRRMMIGKTRPEG